MLIDTHSHIYLKEFDADRDSVLLRAENEGVKKILLPAIDSETHAATLQIEEQFPQTCLAMMGLHPCSVKENFEYEIQLVKDFFDKRKFVAVGETGLDFYWDLTFKEQQYDAFQIQIDIAKRLYLPVVIHSRNSIDECISVIKQNQDGNLKGVFHCFSGNTMQAQRIMELGFYLGIGGVVTFKNSGLDKVMQEIDLSKVVLETDAPYLAPVPFRGKRNECSYLKYIVSKLAEIKEMSNEEIEEITTKNAQALFGI